MNEQKQIIQSLIQTINEQQYYIEAKLEERDKHLIETKKNEEMKKQIAAAQQKRWWQFWKQDTHEDGVLTHPCVSAKISRFPKKPTQQSASSASSNHNHPYN